MVSDQELLSRIALSFLPAVGPVVTRALVRHCGSAEAVFQEKKGLLARIPGVGARRIAKAFATPVMPLAERELQFIRRHRISPLFFTDDDYPQRLMHCHDAPALLYAKGNIGFNSGRFVAVVGTRHNTAYGSACVESLVSGLAVYGCCIVSGLAYGIDIHAHESALDCGMSTVGVTAHGLDRVYPNAHRAVARRMLNQGGLLTEYPSGTPPDRENFPSRNRIVAGMCDAVIVVEAAEKGGALITADLANGYDREVFAVPGRVDDPRSAGCNQLIRHHKANLITSADDVAWMMGWKDQRKPVSASVQTALFDPDPESAAVLRVLREAGDCGLEILVSKSGMSLSVLPAILLRLELEGLVKALPGQRYRLKP